MSKLKIHTCPILWLLMGVCTSLLMIAGISLYSSLGEIHASTGILSVIGCGLVLLPIALLIWARTRVPNLRITKPAPSSMRIPPMFKPFHDGVFIIGSVVGLFAMIVSATIGDGLQILVIGAPVLILAMCAGALVFLVLSQFIDIHYTPSLREIMLRGGHPKLYPFQTAFESLACTEFLGAALCAILYKAWPHITYNTCPIEISELKAMLALGITLSVAMLLIRAVCSKRYGSAILYAETSGGSGQMRIVNGKQVELSDDEYRDEKKFHNERIAFAVVQDRLRYIEQDIRPHSEWLAEDYGLSFTDIEQVTRGYIHKDDIKIYVSSHFFPVMLERLSIELLNELVQLHDDKFGDCDVIVYNGVQVGRVGDIWPPIYKLAAFTKESGTRKCQLFDSEIY